MIRHVTYKTAYVCRSTTENIKYDECDVCLSFLSAFMCHNENLTPASYWTPSDGMFSTGKDAVCSLLSINMNVIHIKTSYFFIMLFSDRE